MTTTATALLSHRDRAVLRAVAAGRCVVSIGAGTSLAIDGLPYCDQFAGPRLLKAGLISSHGNLPAPVRLTSFGREQLRAS